MAAIIDELATEIEGLTNDVRRMNSASTITINGGGIGVWIATICCALMLGATVVGAVVLIDQQRRIDDMTHYLQAIYAQAPQLKPDKETE